MILTQYVDCPLSWDIQEKALSSLPLFLYFHSLLPSSFHRPHYCTHITSIFHGRQGPPRSRMGLPRSVQWKSANDCLVLLVMYISYGFRVLMGTLKVPYKRFALCCIPRPLIRVSLALGCCSIGLSPQKHTHPCHDVLFTRVGLDLGSWVISG